MNNGVIECKFNIYFYFYYHYQSLRIPITSHVVDELMDRSDKNTAV